MRYCTYFDEEVTEEDCQDCSENPEECEYLIEDRFKNEEYYDVVERND